MKGGTYVIVHIRGSMQGDPSIVRPLHPVFLSAVEIIICTVVEMVFLSYEADVFHPVPGLFGLLSIRIIAGVAGKASTDIEEACIGDGVFVVVSVIEFEDLPLQASATGSRMPEGCLLVEHRLSQGQPLRLIIRGVGELAFGGLQRRYGPERLIVVSFGPGLIFRHEILRRARLVHHALDDDIIVGVIAGVSPVVDQGTEHSTGLPPVVRLWKIARNIAGLVARIVRHQLFGDGLCGLFDGLCLERSRFFLSIICVSWHSCSWDIRF